MIRAVVHERLSRDVNINLTVFDQSQRDCPRRNSAVCCDFQVQWLQRQRSHYRDKRLPARDFNHSSTYSKFSVAL